MRSATFETGFTENSLKLTIPHCTAMEGKGGGGGWARFTTKKKPFHNSHVLERQFHISLKVDANKNNIIIVIGLLKKYVSCMVQHLCFEFSYFSAWQFNYILTDKSYWYLYIVQSVFKTSTSDDLRKASDVFTLVQSSEVDHINYYLVLCLL
jgi:hypothetical protein